MNDFNALLRRYGGLQADIVRQRGVIADKEKDGQRTARARMRLSLLEGDLSRLQHSVWGCGLGRRTPDA
jgi:hypothetical protein